MIVGGGATPNYGFQIFGHTTPTVPVFEVLPQANAASSITNIRGKLYINNTQAIDNSRNLYANYSLLGRSFRSANRGELHLNATGANDVSEIFFGYGDGFTEANIRWGISDRGTSNGNLHIYRGPVLNGYRVGSGAGVVTINASREFSGTKLSLTSGGAQYIRATAASGTLNLGSGNTATALRIETNGSISAVTTLNTQAINATTLSIGSTQVITSGREIQNVTFASALYTDEYGKSLVGNFGQFQAHSTYASGFNASVAMWGWNYVQGNANAPNANSSQWYRNRVSLGDGYGYNYDSGDYWLEMAYPRYSPTTAGHM